MWMLTSISFFAVVLLYPEERELATADDGYRLIELAEEKGIVADFMTSSFDRASLVG
jgi:hypothetical protein